MFVLSQAVVSVFAFTVMFNVFFFDPTQSMETMTNFTSCNACITAECHAKNNFTCVVSADNCTFSCLSCNATLDNGDQQFYNQSTCTETCSDPTKCTCDGACWVCAINSNVTKMTCNPPILMVNESCVAIPYMPPNISFPTYTTPPTTSS